MTSHYQRSDCQFRSKVCCESTLLLLQQRARLTAAEARKYLDIGERRQDQWRRYPLGTRAAKPHGGDAVVLSVIPPTADRDVFVPALSRQRETFSSGSAGAGSGKKALAPRSDSER